MDNLPSLFDKSPKPKNKIAFTIFVLLGIFFILLTRLWYLQAVKGEEYRTLSEGNRVRLKRLRAPRGLILDFNHRVLVQNRPSFTVSIVPEDVHDMDEVLFRLSSLIDVSKDQMKETIKASRSLPFEPIILKSDLSFREVALLEEHRNDLPGITVDVEDKRYYPYQSLAAHLLGYMGEINLSQLKKEEFRNARSGDLIGQAGLEKVTNSFLMGKDGGKNVEVDAEGRELRTIGYLAPIPGQNIILTLDLDLQKRAEEILGEKCGTIIAMDPGNGNILAMVSYPSFNPNLFAKGISQKEWSALINNPKDPLQNRAIMAHYPPGSIFKIVLASAGLETGTIDEWSSFFCGGHITLGNWLFYCWKKGGHGELSIHEAIVNSCNVFFYQLGSRLGIDTIAQFARKYGLGSPTGIILPGENSGLIPDSQWKKEALNTSWYPGETISASIGQGYILVTPIQLVSFISAFANGGFLYQPRIINSIETPEGAVIKEFPIVLKKDLPIKKENLQIIRIALRGVVNENGTGWRAYIPEIVVAGKTGTAQVAKLRDQEKGDSDDEDKIPEHLRDHAWFVAFAPFNQPEIAVVVLLEHGGHGGYSSAPLAKEIISAYLLGEKHDR
ncbi:MAG: penicillin-binding protein 2 [bacterium]